MRDLLREPRIWLIVFLILGMIVAVADWLQVPLATFVGVAFCERVMGKKCASNFYSQFGVAIPFLLFVLWVASDVLYPSSPNTGRFFRFWHLLFFFFHGRGPGTLVQDGRLPNERLDLEDGVVVVDGVGAALIKHEKKGLRVVGPGVHPTNGESLLRVFDMRLQWRDTGVRSPKPAETADGIPVRIDYEIIFVIDPVTEHEIPPRDRRLAVFTDDSQTSIYTLAYQNEPAESAGSDKTLDWREEVAVLAETQVRDIAGTYLLDDLYAPFDLARHPRHEFQNRVRESLEPLLQSRGIRLISFRVGRIRPVEDDVIRQRISSWQSERARVVQYMIQRGVARAAHEKSKAQARAQLRLLSNLMAGLENVSLQDRNEMIRLRLAKSLATGVRQNSASPD